MRVRKKPQAIVLVSFMTILKIWRVLGHTYSILIASSKTLSNVFLPCSMPLKNLSIFKQWQHSQINVVTYLYKYYTSKLA